MKINFSFLSKSFALAVAAVSLSLSFTNSTEAAYNNYNYGPRYGYERHHDGGYQHHQKYYDVWYFNEWPKHHKVCNDYNHRRWAPHFHCTNRSHEHRHAWHA